MLTIILVQSHLDFGLCYFIWHEIVEAGMRKVDRADEYCSSTCFRNSSSNDFQPRSRDSGWANCVEQVNPIAIGSAYKRAAVGIADYQ